ncbi:MAG TPA: hypothetical protein VFE30_00020 [Anaeromyxobacteraceae bacterium]|nr:hypothetical protein [Anaeromyxobacteraceae bacterium]
MIAAALSLALSMSLSAGGAGAGEHLLAGAGLFREARYAEALVEFRVAQRLGAAEAAGYAGATLVQLGRPDEALEAFGGPDAPARDALLDYYRGLAAFDARLYLAADRALTSLGSRAGPRIAGQAARLRQEIATALSGEPPRTAVDWYLARCAEYRGQQREVLARAFCRESSELGARRADRYGAQPRSASEPASQAKLAGSRP